MYVHGARRFCSGPLVVSSVPTAAAHHDDVTLRRYTWWLQSESVRKWHENIVGFG